MTKTIYATHSDTCGQAHYYKIEIDELASRLHGELIYKLREVRPTRGLQVQTIIIDELEGVV